MPVCVAYIAPKLSLTHNFFFECGFMSARFSFFFLCVSMCGHKKWKSVAVGATVSVGTSILMNRTTHTMTEQHTQNYARYEYTPKKYTLRCKTVLSSVCATVY